MITYLKHVGNFKHSNLKSRKFEDIQALYKNIKRFNEHFISTGSAKDERFIKRMNEKGAGLSKSEVIKEDTKEEVKDEDKDEESTRKRKLGTRKKMKSRKRRYIQHTSEDDSDKENDDLRLYLTIAQDEDKEVDYEILDRKYPIIDWKTECFGTKPQPDEAKSIEEINLNVVTRSNGQQRHFSVLTSVLSIFDREDLNAVYQLVMNKYQDEMPEGFERVLWGDLMVLFNPDEQDEFWSSQHEWKIISWKLHSSSGVHTLMTNEGVVIHMLTEKKYPLKKEILVQMLNLRLESEEESTMALELIRFIKKGNQLTLLLGEELASPRSNSSCVDMVDKLQMVELDTVFESTAILEEVGCLDVGRTQEPIVVEVSTQEPIVTDVSTQEPIIAEISTQEPIMAECNDEFDESARTDEEFFYDDERIDTAYETEYDVQSSEDAGTDDDDDVDEDFLVDEENEIVEPDVDVHLFGISMDLPFDNIGITNLVSDDVLEGEDVDVINADGFDSDPGNDECWEIYCKRLNAGSITVKSGIIS
ncbi:hypothetical protein Tco_0612475 [Tanacetum coccineum]